MNVPVLARVIEAAGIPTVTVTMMPVFADRARLSRTVGVPFPFGQAFGPVGDDDTHRIVAEAAVRLVASATEPETRVDLDLEWPDDVKTAYRAWQPPEPSPIVEAMLDTLRKARRNSDDASGR